ncbi:lon protease 2, partial [Striga asiatica]
MINKNNERLNKELVSTENEQTYRITLQSEELTGFGTRTAEKFQIDQKRTPPSFRRAPPAVAVEIALVWGVGATPVQSLPHPSFSGAALFLFEASLASCMASRLTPDLGDVVVAEGSEFIASFSPRSSRFPVVEADGPTCFGWFPAGYLRSVGEESLCLVARFSKIRRLEVGLSL